MHFLNWHHSGNTSNDTGNNTSNNKSYDSSRNLIKFSGHS